MKQNPTKVWRQLFRVVDSLSVSNAVLVDRTISNLTYNQLRMMKMVYILNRDFPEGVTLKVLAESLGITPAAASEMVDAMVRKEVLLRELNAQDRRAVAIQLSEDCRQRFLEGEKNFDRLIGDFFKTVSKEEIEAFDSTLDRLQEFLQKK